MKKGVYWEVLGLINSLNRDEVLTENIVVAKLLEGVNNKAVIVQYENEILAL